MRSDECGQSKQVSVFLNPFEDIEKHLHHLPHWQQGEVWQFVTWRLGDSLPEGKLSQWKEERREWLASHPEPWDDAARREFHGRFTERMDKWLDAGHGSCLLRDGACASIVEGALRHFDRERYALGPYVVMPNHVHVLFQPIAPHSVAAILHSWKSFTAKEINKLRGTHGLVWQEDYWDTMIRSECQWHVCRSYIERNPAHLAGGGFCLGAGSASVPP
ncbi:transposase [Candidatus Poribacteria bacterium]|nr:transposase [Candidatus Poribacteria bacterium]